MILQVPGIMPLQECSGFEKRQQHQSIYHREPMPCKLLCHMFNIKQESFQKIMQDGEVDVVKQDGRLYCTWRESKCKKNDS